MSEPTPTEQFPPLPIQHVKATTAVFVGVTELAYRTRSDLITGQRTNLESAVNQPIQIKSWSHFQQIFGGFLQKFSLPDAVYGYFSNGGSPCYVVSIQVVSEKDSGYPQAETYSQAFQSLANLAEKYLLLCPDLAYHHDGAVVDSTHIKQLQRAMIAHCEQREGCFAILDTLPGLNAQEAVEYRQLLEADSTSAALYYPWIRVADLSDSATITKAAPPSGHVAGIFFRVQQEYGRILAPANEVVLNAIDLLRYVTQGEDDILLLNQVNCIRPFSARGIRLWGARTLGNEFIVVGDAAGAASNASLAAARIPTIESLETVTAAFIGITEDASIKDKNLYSGEIEIIRSVVNQPYLVTSWQAYTAVFGSFLDHAYLPEAVYGFFANGGQYCYIISIQSVYDNDAVTLPPLTASDYIGDIAERSGLSGLEALDSVDLIVCPDVMRLDHVSILAVQTAVITHCEMMRNRIAILDTPPDLNPQQAKEWRHYSNYDSSYAIMYYPWIDILDQADRRKRIPPSGHIAGIYQRQSQQYGLHKPPANAGIRGAVNLEYDLTNGETDILTPIGINCLRAFPGRGIRPWGTRTLSSDFTYRYIHTRRMLIMIMSAIYQGTSWVQFELHDLALLSHVSQQIANFLEALRVKGLLFGNSPEEAYTIQCDEELNPPEKQQQGELTAKIGVALTQNYISQFYIRQSNSIRRSVVEVYF